MSMCMYVCAYACVCAHTQEYIQARLHAPLSPGPAPTLANGKVLELLDRVLVPVLVVGGKALEDEGLVPDGASLACPCWLSRSRRLSTLCLCVCMCVHVSKHV